MRRRRELRGVLKYLFFEASRSSARPLSALQTGGLYDDALIFYTQLLER
jgi:hypothetical protein